MISRYCKGEHMMISIKLFKPNLNSIDSKIFYPQFEPNQIHLSAQNGQTGYQVKLFQIITYSQQMKHQESLRTETTKQSLIQVPLSDRSAQESVKVFMHYHHRIFSITLPLLSKSVNTLIREALEQMNQVYSLKLEVSPDQYTVYAARRNGNKCRDYPCLDDKQNILLTNLRFYCLVRKNQPSRDLAYPLSHFNLEVQKKQEKKVKKNTACFCIF